MATLKIPLDSPDKTHKLFHILRLLSEVGISFDTGCGGGCMDWELDWSLKGAYLYPHKGEKLNDFKREEMDKKLCSSCKV